MPIKTRVDIRTAIQPLASVDGISAEQARLAGVSLLLMSASVVLAILYFAGRLLTAATG